MKNGDFIMTAASLIADNGDEVPANSVGEIHEIDGQFKVVVKHKGEVVYISDYNPKDVVEVW